jgi:hypothetical protein
MKHRKREHLRGCREFPRNRLKWRRVGDFPARIRHHDVAWHTAHLRQTLAVIGIGSQRRWRNEDQGKQPTQAKQLQCILL